MNTTSGWNAVVNAHKTGRLRKTSYSLSSAYLSSPRSIEADKSIVFPSSSMPTKLVVFTIIEIDRGHMEEFFSIMSEYAAVGTMGSGRCCVELMQDQTASNKFIIVEEFSNDEAYETHKYTENYKALLAFRQSVAVVHHTASTFVPVNRDAFAAVKKNMLS